MTVADAPVACLSGCGRPAQRRGLCVSCYRKVSRRVWGGETTWEQLECEGHCLPAKPHPWRKRKEHRR